MCIGLNESMLFGQGVDGEQALRSNTRTPAWQVPQACGAYGFSDFVADVGRCGRRLDNPACSPPIDPSSLLAALCAAMTRSMNGLARYQAAPRHCSNGTAEVFGGLLDALSDGSGCPSELEPSVCETPHRRPVWLLGGMPPGSCAGTGEPQPTASPNLCEALGVLLADFCAIACNGRIGVEELRKATRGDLGNKVARAASLLLDNPTLLNGIALAFDRVQGGGCASEGGLTADALRLGQRLAASSSKGLDGGSALRTLESYFDRAAQADGSADSISIADLESAAANPLYPELGGAARRLLSDPLLRLGVDVASQRLAGDTTARADGRISRVDILAALRSMPLKPAETEILSTMGKYQDSLWPGGSPLATGQIRSMALGAPMPDGGTTTKELQTTMHRLLRTPALLDRLDAGTLLERMRLRRGRAGGGAASRWQPVSEARDGIITLDDLRAVLAGKAGHTSSGEDGELEAVRRKYRHDVSPASRRAPASVASVPTTSAWTRPMEPEILGGEDVLGGYIGLAMLSNLRSTGADTSVVNLMTSALSTFRMTARAA